MPDPVTPSAGGRSAVDDELHLMVQLPGGDVWHFDWAQQLGVALLHRHLIPQEFEDFPSRSSIAKQWRCYRQWAGCEFAVADAAHGIGYYVAGVVGAARPVLHAEPTTLRCETLQPVEVEFDAGLEAEGVTGDLMVDEMHAASTDAGAADVGGGGCVVALTLPIALGVAVTGPEGVPCYHSIQLPLRVSALLLCCPMGSA
mmetsp:Transcript_44999/g.109345  ORF Transcript_44999/g.109345 Transcript_44999/m.109345 type:complete len:200 (-) Transcript_44999:2357-2956(-)